jgi:hypothetical protein
VEQAIAAGVYAPEIWRRVNYYDPQAVVSVVDYFRRHGLSVFATKAARWNGQELGSVFALSEGCVGYVDGAEALPSDRHQGLRVRGWAWDDRDRETADAIVITNQDGRIVGTARTLHRRDDVSRALPGRVLTPWVGWRGFVAVGEARLDAYLVRDEDNTACKVGELIVPPSAPP